MMLRLPKVSKFQGLLLLLLIIGIVLLSEGLWLYCNYRAGSPSLPRKTTGIFIEYGPRQNMSIGWGRITFVPQKRLIELYFSFSYYAEGNYSFQVSLPYTIQSMRNITSQIVFQYWEFENCINGCIVFVTVQNNDSQGNVLLAEQLSVEESIALSSFGVYSVDISFGGSMPLDIANARRSIKERNTLEEVQVHVMIPFSALNIASSYRINTKSFEQSGQLLTFDLTKYEPLLISYTVFEEVDLYQQYLFWSGLLLGIGLPLFVSAFIELIRIYAMASREPRC